MIASFSNTRSGLLSALRVASLLVLLLPAPQAAAEDRWNPFPDHTERPKQPKPATSDRSDDRSPYLPPMQGPADTGRPAPYSPAGRSPYDRPPPSYAGPVAPAPGSATATASSTPSSTVERGELAPVMSQESGLPYAMWQGLTVSDAEQLVAPLDLPSRSAALQSLWLRMLATTNAGPQDRDFAAFRTEALYRSGRLEEAAALLASATSGRDEPTLLALKARVEIARGNLDSGCPAAKSVASQKSKVAAGLRGEIIVLAGYCAVAAGNKSAAGLAADLARDAGYRGRFTLTVLDAIASGRSTRSVLPERITALDYQLLQQAGFDQPGQLVARASPALLAQLAANRDIAADVRVAAAERAARRNIIAPAALAEAYRQYSAGATAAAPNAAAERAELFQQADRTRTPLSRTRTVRTLVDAARRADLALPVLVALYPIVDQIRPAQEISWFSSTAIEVMLAAADYRAILPWIALSDAADRVYDERLGHWRVLADLADPAVKSSEMNLAPLEALALRGRFSGPALHRLTTVLDALDYNIPIPVWDAANRAPKPPASTLPPTGILTQLLTASKNRESARTALLAMRAIGASGPAGAHVIALGDAIRGLKRAGLEKEAKRLAFETVFASWPRPRGY